MTGPDYKTLRRLAEEWADGTCACSVCREQLRPLAAGVLALLGERAVAMNALEDVAESARRLLRHGHDFWEQHEQSPDSDEMSAALTALYMALKRHGLESEPAPVGSAPTGENGQSE